MQQRASDATGRLRTLFDVADLKVLSAAVAEAAADEAVRNPAFRTRVRRLYDELAALSPGRPRPLTRLGESQAEGEPVPLPGTEAIHIDPFAPLDPYILLRLYGPRQMRPALARYSFTSLKEAAKTVRDRHPSTKPRDGRKADALLDYIVEHVAPGR
jgi:hypothetical protein